MERKLRLSVLICAASLAGLALAETGTTASGDDLVYSATALPGGKTLTSWAVAHTKWATQHSAPADLKNCSKLPQPSAPTRFVPLVSGKETVRCTFPAGGAIVFPAGANYCAVDAKTPASKLRSVCDAGVAQVKSVTLTVDGTPISALMTDYRILTPIFSASYPKGNTFGASPGTIKTVAAGWVIILRPLPPGQHTLRGTLKIKKGPTFVGTYLITVK